MSRIVGWFDRWAEQRMNVPGAGGECIGIVRHGSVVLEAGVEWPDGTRVVVRTGGRSPVPQIRRGPAVVAGFGLAGRGVADLLDRAEIDFVIVESNAKTVHTQRALGRRVVEGDISDEGTLASADIASASLLALTIPDEDVVLRATAIARRMNREVYIIARTRYASAGMRATELGADEVIKSEQAVALLFSEKLRRRLLALE